MLTECYNTKILTLLSVLNDINKLEEEIMENISIIGCDIASKDSKDFSCVNVFCSKCKSLIDTILLEDIEGDTYWKKLDYIEHNLDTQKECPVCKTKFNGKKGNKM